PCPFPLARPSPFGWTGTRWAGSDRTVGGTVHSFKPGGVGRTPGFIRVVFFGRKNGLGLGVGKKGEETMGLVAVGFGVALIILGVGSYLGTDRVSITAMIPAFFG